MKRKPKDGRVWEMCEQTCRFVSVWKAEQTVTSAPAAVCDCVCVCVSKSQEECQQPHPVRISLTIWESLPIQFISEAATWKIPLASDFTAAAAAARWKPGRKYSDFMFFLSTKDSGFFQQRNRNILKISKNNSWRNFTTMSLLKISRIHKKLCIFFVYLVQTGSNVKTIN